MPFVVPAASSRAWDSPGPKLSEPTLTPDEVHMQSHQERDSFTHLLHVYIYDENAFFFEIQVLGYSHTPLGIDCIHTMSSRSRVASRWLIPSMSTCRWQERAGATAHELRDWMGWAGQQPGALLQADHSTIRSSNVRTITEVMVCQGDRAAIPSRIIRPGWVICCKVVGYLKIQPCVLHMYQTGTPQLVIVQARKCAWTVDDN